jgi:hypothetical protein
VLSRKRLARGVVFQQRRAAHEAQDYRSAASIPPESDKNRWLEIANPRRVLSPLFNCASFAVSDV